MRAATASSPAVRLRAALLGRPGGSTRMAALSRSGTGSGAEGCLLSWTAAPLLGHPLSCLPADLSAFCSEFASN